MKSLRRAAASILAAALVLLAPGPRAWAQVAAVESARAANAPIAAPTVSAISFGAAAPILPVSAALSASTLSAAAALPASAAPEAAAAIPSAPAAAAEAPQAEPAAAAAAAALVPAPETRAAAAAPLAETARLLGAARVPGARAAALERLFTGARRALGLDAAPQTGVFAKSAPAAPSGLAPASSARFSADRSVPAPLGLAAAGTAAVAAHAAAAPIAIAAVIVSLVLHEIGHAKVAAALGDTTAARAGRASFNPLAWWRHVDPVLTIALPLATWFMGGFIFGGAKPVPVEPAYFRHPARDMALVAAAGPAVNLALAGVGALGYAAAAALGLGAVAMGALSAFVFVNAALGLFNLIPVRPLDGGHILAALLPPAVSARLDAAYARLGAFSFAPAIALALLGGGAVMAAAALLTNLLLGVAVAATGVQLAGVLAPVAAGVGLMGVLGGAPAQTPAAPAPGTASFVVVYNPDSGPALGADLHLARLDARSSTYARDYQRAYSTLMADAAAHGVSADELASFNASPVASYRRINAATFTLDAAKAEAFAAALRLQGHAVYPNERRRIIAPIVTDPQAAGGAARAVVTMAENLRLTHADSVQAIARARWGAPDMNPWRRALKAAGALLGLGGRPPSVKVGVVDSGADTTHPLLRRVKKVLNFTTSPNTDDIGHGSWVTSMVLNYAPWLSEVTHYKTFTEGGATLDDILKALTAAADDGNLVIANSWGSDDGDPDSPDSQLVRKLAQEGHIMVFSAGNSGPGANTIGSPAIVEYKDPQTGAVRVVSVAATDRNRRVASFSSVGPGSAKTAGKPGVQRPDLASVGVNTEGAWPAALGDADRVDPAAGPLKAISGTSMSQPTVSGAIALLAMLFGATELGPRLDAVVSAVMSTLDKGVGDADHVGGGFLNVQAAYDALAARFGAPRAVAGRRP